MKIAIIGYGKMGKTIEKVAQERDHKIVAKISRDDKLLPLKNVDVALEFTSPGSAYDNILSCFEKDIPVVSGTTGWRDKFSEVEERCKKEGKSFFYAANFNIGMNLVFALNRKLAEWMNHQPQYDVAISETHHTEKKDAPSGTAATIADDITSILERKKKWDNTLRQQEADSYPNPDNPPSSLKVSSYRQKGVPGIHRIMYASNFDTIEIKHTAHSRKGFALGAIIAAEWLKGKKGCYGMKDLLNLQ